MMDTMLISQLAKKNVMTIQLLGKGDTTIDDAVTTQEKWQQYVDSYTLVCHPSPPTDVITDLQTHPTEGLGKQVKGPFLNRNLEKVSDQVQETQFGGNENLSLKIAYGSFRMFFVPGAFNSSAIDKANDQQRPRTTSIVRVRKNNSKASLLRRQKLRGLRVIFLGRSST